MAKKFDPTKHELVPKHVKMSEKECKELFETYGVAQINLPRISKTDPAIQHLKVKEGDIIKIIRESPTAGEAVFYRVVMS